MDARSIRFQGATWHSLHLDAPVAPHDFVGGVTLDSKAAAVLIAALAAGAIDAFPAGAGSSQRLTNVLIFEVTRPPPGWIEFCERQPRDCAGATTTPRDFALTPEALEPAF